MLKYFCRFCDLDTGYEIYFSISEHCFISPKYVEFSYINYLLLKLPFTFAKIIQKSSLD